MILKTGFIAGRRVESPFPSTTSRGRPCTPSSVPTPASTRRATGGSPGTGGGTGNSFAPHPLSHIHPHSAPPYILPASPFPLGRCPRASSWHFKNSSSNVTLSPDSSGRPARRTRLRQAGGSRFFASAQNDKRLTPLDALWASPHSSTGKPVVFCPSGSDKDEEAKPLLNFLKGGLLARSPDRSGRRQAGGNR